MYDPARDIFTSSEDAPVSPDDERSNDLAVQREAEETSQSMPNPSDELREKGETDSRAASRV